MLISPLSIPRYFHLKPLAWERERRTLKASRRVTVHRWWSLGIIEYIEIRKSYIRIWEKYRIRGNLCTGNLQLEKTTCHGEPESEFYSKYCRQIHLLQMAKNYYLHYFFNSKFTRRCFHLLYRWVSRLSLAPESYFNFIRLCRWQSIFMFHG